jgi:hypothetical protein
VRLNAVQFTDDATQLIARLDESGMWNHENESDPASDM